MTAEIQAAHPGKNRWFAPFEWMLAGRYLRSRRKETFISIIAGLSFWDHFGRCNSDHRHGGDEWVPYRAVDQNSRH